MTPLELIGYYLIYGTFPTALFLAVFIIHYVDTHWLPERFIAFKVKWFRRCFTWGLPTWGVLFFIGLLLTHGGLAR